jgi:hypothetical protein
LVTMHGTYNVRFVKGIILSLVFVGGTEENHEIPQDSQCLERDSNLHLPNAYLKR